MRPLLLDFSSRRKPKLMGVAASVLALLWLGYCVDTYASLKQQETQLHAKLSKLQNSLKQGAGRDTSSSPKLVNEPEIANANKVINRLTVPWEALFHTVEAVNFSDAALLSIQPELDKQSLTLTAEAKDLVSMLEYIKRLSAGPMLVNIKLVSHQIQQQDPQKPIRFVIHADWVTRDVILLSFPPI